MYSGKAIEASRGNGWKRSSSISNETTTRDKLETRRSGKWGESECEERETADRRKMDSTGGKWKSLVE